jgi:hypothetical protein
VDTIPAVEIWEGFSVTDTGHPKQQLTYLPTPQAQGAAVYVQNFLLYKQPTKYTISKAADVTLKEERSRAADYW